ncbi:hypothetical protein [Nocardia sp. NPDC057030]|uniref:hypothetical protein n=1 Tax=unclassified Nocardia TaxID=2637762 RepID=UPI0036392338
MVTRSSFMASTTHPRIRQERIASMMPRINRRSARAVTVSVAMGASLVLTAAPALADTEVGIKSAGIKGKNALVEVDYSCDASSGVTKLAVQVKDVDSQTLPWIGGFGETGNLTCDGSRRLVKVKVRPADRSKKFGEGHVLQVYPSLLDSKGAVIVEQAGGPCWKDGSEFSRCRSD